MERQLQGGGGWECPGMPSDPATAAMNTAVPKALLLASWTPPSASPAPLPLFQFPLPSSGTKYRSSHTPTPHHRHPRSPARMTKKASQPSAPDPASSHPWIASCAASRWLMRDRCVLRRAGSLEWLIMSMPGSR